MKNKTQKQLKSQKTLRIGVVTSQFNQEVTEMLESGALQALKASARKGPEKIEYKAIRVPGAIEIPLACQVFLDQGYDGVVALGCVIRGETTHYEFVCNSVEAGLTRLMLDYKKPIGSGVLTTETEEQAFDRVGGEHGHKGQEAADVVLYMIRTLQDLKISPKKIKKTKKTKKIKKAN